MVVFMYLTGLAIYAILFKLVDTSEKNLIANKSEPVMITLFIIAIGVFGYLCYVLVKPEKF